MGKTMVDPRLSATVSIQNQHWVPKFLIKHFADGDGRVFRLDIASDNISKPPPKFAASALNFNDFVIDGQAVSFEEELEKIETRAAPIIKRIVDRLSLAGLSPDDRHRVANFTAAQSIRTRAFRNGFSDQRDSQTFGRTFQRMFESLFVTAGDITARDWALLVIRNDDVFYLGDNPVVLQWTETPGAGGNLGFDVKGVEAYLPLSPKCALYMPCPDTCRTIRSGYEAALQIQNSAQGGAFRGQQIGADELQLAERFLKSAHPLYTAFTTDTPLEANRANIECINSLQCLYSDTALYSNRRDFAFAKHVFEYTPKYRSVQKTSLLEVSVLVRDTESEP